MMTDPRFGQFSDPQYMRNTFGVLPAGGNTNGGVQSASSPRTNTGRQTQPGNPAGDPNTPWETGSMGGLRYQLDRSKATLGTAGGGLGTQGSITALDTGHGILTDPFEINRFQQSTAMATGGVVPDGEDDTPDDAMDVIGQVLSYGRKKNGMPEKLFSWIPTRPAGPGGDKPDDNPFPTKDGGFGKRVGMNDTEEPDTQTFLHGGDVTNPTINQDDEENAGSFAEGGMIPEAGDTGDNQAENTEQPAPANQQMNPQMAMRYLSGADAMAPDLAAAMEAQVDPQGQMDPATRKLQAIAKAGDPEKAWGLMQHYRQKFNAYSAFARVAAEGTPQKPADLNAAAKAATQAYENVPDGTSLAFQPAPGGIKVAINKVSPSRAAPSGEDTRKTQKFADGGDVEGEQAQPEDWGAYLRRGLADTGQPGESGVMPDPNAGTPVSQSDDVGDPNAGIPVSQPPFPGGTAPHQALKEVFLSIPQFIKWLTGPGQMDSVADKGVEQTLADAQKQAPGAAAKPTPSFLTQDYRPPASQLPAFPGTAQPGAARPGSGGQQQGAQPGEDTVSPDLEQLANQLFPNISQEGQRTQYIANIMAQRAAQQNALAVATQQGVNQTDRTKLLVRGRENVANIQGATRLSAEQLKQDHADTRNRLTNDTRFKIGTQAQAALANRALQSNITRLITAEMNNKPGLVGRPEELAKNLEPLVAPMGLKGTEAVKWYYTQSPGPQAPQAPQVPQPQAPRAPQPAQAQPQQVKIYQGRRYTRGPNGEAVDIGPAQ
jgi:hypothetical protein